jgi:hypothetical protein
MPSFFIIALSLLSVTIFTIFLLFSALFPLSRVASIIILSSLILVSVGFMATLELSRTFNNEITRFLYLFFSLGIGLFFYLTISAILFQISKLIFPKITTINSAISLIILAVILFLIGLVQANTVMVRDVSVNMAGLPKNWHGKKIVQISDVHLGSINGLNFLKKQVTKINAQKPDLIVITGDLFDGVNYNLESFGRELAKLEAKEGVIFVSGNHDTYVGVNNIEAILKNNNIIFLRNEMINIDGLEVIGLDFYKLSGNDSNVVIKNLSAHTGQSRLLLNHVPNNITLAKSLNITLQLSGHSHNGQMFPLFLLTRLIYGNYHYGLHTEGDYNIYTSSGLGSWGPPVRTFNPAEIVSIILN